MDVWSAMYTKSAEMAAASHGISSGTTKINRAVTCKLCIPLQWILYIYNIQKCTNSNTKASVSFTDLESE